MEYTFYDSNNDLGFGEDAEILVEIDYSCRAGSPPGWEDPGESPECTINGCDIMSITTVDNEDINWSTLCPEKQAEVTAWAHDKADTAEVHEHCFEREERDLEDYADEMRETREEARQHRYDYYDF